MKSEIDGKILKKLEEWERRDGSLSPWLEFYHKLLHIQCDTSITGITALALSREDASKRLRNGAPILQFGDLAIDWQMVQKAWQEIGALFRNYAQILGNLPEILNGRVITPALLKKTAEAWFEGIDLPQQVLHLDTAGTITNALALFTLRPFLINHCKAVISLVEQERWRRGYCPICGGNPDFAFLEKEVGARWLLCARCDTEWLFQRMECPYCGNLDQKALSYFTDEKEIYRLYVCEKCHYYLKTIDLRKSEDEVLLPLQRFLTIDLDTQAGNEGYLPAPSARYRETMQSK